MTKKQLQALKTFTDICNAQGKNESDYDPSKVKAAWEKAAIHLRRLKLICKPFNGGETPKLADIKQRKNYAWAWIEEDSSRPFGFRLSYYDFGFDYSGSYLGARPYLLDSDWVEHVFNTFILEFEEWMYWENMSFQEE